VQHVAQEFPELCDAETEAIGRLVGRHVQRLATIAHGDGVCTTHIPLIPLMPVTVTSGRTSS
jgi:predicted ArsR family transcriptional regulator